MRAAVLVPIETTPSREKRLVLIRRATGDHAHQGQVAFPGGLHDPGRDESLLATALREAEEEIGLSPGAVRIVCVLPDQRTLSTGYLITPFVAEVPAGYSYRADAREVSRIFKARLSRFAAAECREQMSWEHKGVIHLVPCVHVGGCVVWGVTLRIIDELLRVSRSA